ncbi:MAG TPA: hypothetical protein VMU05_13390 [Dongiaceae bacterium]|nr:hypothetical protein [Dongiaceae bacterium]
METLKAETDQEAESRDVAGLQQQVASLADSVQKLQAQLADQAKLLADLMARLSGPGAPVQSQAEAPAAALAAQSEISPEILVVIAAAVTAFLGKQVRIRSAKMLQSPYEIVNPWAQQGRVFVQASHYYLRRS